MDVYDLVLPKMFANVRMTLWLPGQWPCLAELMGRGTRPTPAWTVVDQYAQRRHAWMESVKRAMRAGSRVPLLSGDVIVAFWHQRTEYAEKDRTEYSRTAERFILPPLVRSGSFREDAIRGVSHLFDRAEPDAAGVYVLVSEYPRMDVESDADSTIAPRFAGPPGGRPVSPTGPGVFSVTPHLEQFRPGPPDGSRKKAGPAGGRSPRAQQLAFGFGGDPPAR
jgi:hypothetical protein